MTTSPTLIDIERESVQRAVTVGDHTSRISLFFNLNLTTKEYQTTVLSTLNASHPIRKSSGSLLAELWNGFVQTAETADGSGTRNEPSQSTLFLSIFICNKVVDHSERKGYVA